MKQKNKTAPLVDPSKPDKKTLWQQGLNPKDLEILRRTSSKKPNIRPVDLVTVACLLAQQYGRKTPAQRYFIAADELLRLADNFLSEDREFVVVKDKDRVDKLEQDYNEGYIQIDVAIQEGEKEPGAKKGRSRLGNITTKEGLTKALKRLFPDDYEEKIVTRPFREGRKTVPKPAIHKSTVEQILADQERANKARGVRD